MLVIKAYELKIRGRYSISVIVQRNGEQIGSLVIERTDKRQEMTEALVYVPVLLRVKEHVQAHS